MIGMNTNVNGYWQQAGIYGAAQTSPTNAAASQAYKPNNTMPKMDMPSMLKIMLQMMKMLQGVQGQRYGQAQTQSTFNNAASPYPQMNPADYGKRFLSSSPVAKVPTPATANTNSTAFLFAMLLSQGGMSSILPNLVLTTASTPAPATPTTPTTTSSTDLGLPLLTTTTTAPSTTTTPANTNINALLAALLGTSGLSSSTATSTNDVTGLPIAPDPPPPPPGVYLISGNQYVVSTLEQYISGTSETTGKQFSSTGLSIPTSAAKANPLANKTYIILESGDQDIILGSVDYQATMDTSKTIDFEGKTYDVIFSDTVKRYQGHQGSPLTFDLNGDGVKTSNKMIKYDIDGDGTQDNINDVADGVLSIRGGASGHDVFGNNTDLDGDGKADGFKDGFEALKALSLQEGLIDGKKDMVLDASDLVLLQKKYQLAMKTAGYNSKNENLADLGISEINLGKTNATQTAQNFDGQGNDLMTQEGSTFKLNGQTQDYADVWHQLK